MFRAHKVLSAVALFLLVQALSASRVQAQVVSPLWERNVEGIIVRPLPGGTVAGFSIQPMFRVSAQATTVPLDLSTLVEIAVNGQTLDVLEFAIKTDPTGAAGCNIPCHEQGMVCVCLEGVICSCETILVCDPPVNASLSPGDEITVILRPAPGARPEINEGNDQKRLRWKGKPTVWERAVTSIVKMPSRSVRGATDVHVGIGVLVNHDGMLNLDTLVDIFVNGRPVGSGIADIDDFLWASCSGACDGSVCASLNQGDAGAACQVDPEVGGNTCWCNFPSIGTFVLTGLKLSPDDEIDVRIKPAPGALADLPRPIASEPEPELAVKFKRGDSNSDGKVEMADGILTLGWQFSGTRAPTCLDAADANDDGEVSIADPIYLFGWLFLGGPAPPAPGAFQCGPDPTADRLLECESKVCSTTLQP